MQDTEINIAFADACPDLFWVSSESKELHWQDGDGAASHSDDRDVAIRAIGRIISGTEVLEDRFIQELRNILQRRENDDTICIFRYETAMITAYPSEFTEAFLRTIGKWKD